MYSACGLLFLSFFGFSMLKFITCYSDGYLLESECKGMDVKHGVPPQNSEGLQGFKIEPENETVTDSELGTSITVSLLADHSAQFQGFMLDARECDTCESAGMFSLIDPRNSLLICGGRVVTHPNNLRKKEVNVTWTPKVTGVFFFRAVFAEDFDKYWPRKQIILPSTAAPTTEATSHSTQASSTDTSQTQTAPPTSEATSTQKIPAISPTIFTKTSNTDSHAAALPPECVQYTRYALALLLFSRLCFLGGSSLLMIIRPVSKMATMIASVIEPASKTIAAIFILIKQIKYECVCECDSLQVVSAALTVAAMVSGLLHTIIVFLHCGPSHELRKCWICAIIMVDLMNIVITATAIFFGIWCFQERWLLLLMGVFVIWEVMFYLSSVCFEQMKKCQSRKKLRENQNHILEKRISPWLFMFIIFSVFNVMFTAALMTGVSLVEMENC